MHTSRVWEEPSQISLLHKLEYLMHKRVNPHIIPTIMVKPTLMCSDKWEAHPISNMGEMTLRVAAARTLIGRVTRAISRLHAWASRFDLSVACLCISFLHM